MPAVSQVEFENLLEQLEMSKEKLEKGEKLSLASFLKEYGFSAHLEKINFAVDKKTVSYLALKNIEETIISDTLISDRTSLLKDLDFTGCTIKNCKFDRCDLSGGIFDGISIEGSSFIESIMNDMTINNTQFHSGKDELYCTFDRTSFDYSIFQNVRFDNCTISRSSFNYLKEFNTVTFEDSAIAFTSFVGSNKIKSVTIQASTHHKDEIKDLITDQVIKYKQVKLKKNNPAVLICWSNKQPRTFATLTEKMLLARNLNPVRMDYQPEVDEVALDNEINELNQLTTVKMTELRKIVFKKARKIIGEKEDLERERFMFWENKEPKNESLLDEEISDPKEISNKFDGIWKKEGISFPMLMIEIMREQQAKNSTRFPQMSALYEHTKKMFDQVDGIIIPGGQDMDPRFYGQKSHHKTVLPKHERQIQYTDPRRDVIEFSLVYMQQRAGAPKPLAGICRGSQVIAASYGGMIYQHINAEERRKLFVDILKVPENVSEDTSLLSTKKRIKMTNNNVLGNKLLFAAMFQHHQGYDLQLSQGLDSSVSTKISSGIVIDVVAENLPQNIVITQAHLEVAYDENEKQEKTETGLATRVDAQLSESVFGQFEMRVRAYTHSKKIIDQLPCSSIAKQDRIFLAYSENEDRIDSETIPSRKK
ncbi:MAG: gamma-glutamyl-gamma-aminobutyrate hydrolase family protein [Legionella longbeachae]|nr:gamma-glutamyl-gamma-aminobutyrate hydrolase family protein [Legionella longbeachae]